MSQFRLGEYGTVQYVAPAPPRPPPPPQPQPQAAPAAGPAQLVREREDLADSLALGLGQLDSTLNDMKSSYGKRQERLEDKVDKVEQLNSSLLKIMAKFTRSASGF